MGGAGAQATNRVNTVDADETVVDVVGIDQADDTAGGTLDVDGAVGTDAEGAGNLVRAHEEVEGAIDFAGGKGGNISGKGDVGQRGEVDCVVEGGVEEGAVGGHGGVAGSAGAEHVGLGAEGGHKGVGVSKEGGGTEDTLLKHIRVGIAEDVVATIDVGDHNDTISHAIVGNKGRHTVVALNNQRVGGQRGDGRGTARIGEKVGVGRVNAEGVSIAVRTIKDRRGRAGNGRLVDGLNFEAQNLV